MTISFKTGQVKIPYFIPCSFQRHLSIFLTQHLATSNEILFTKGGFRVKSAPESFSFLAGALPQTPLGELRCFPRRPSRLGRELPTSRYSSQSTHSVSQCPVQFSNYDRSSGNPRLKARLHVPLYTKRVMSEKFFPANLLARH